MSNRAYYEFEQRQDGEVRRCPPPSWSDRSRLIDLIQEADGDQIKHALAGAVKHCTDANFARALHVLMRECAETDRPLCKALHNLQETRR